MSATCMYCASKYKEAIRIIEDTKSKLKSSLFYAGLNYAEVKHNDIKQQLKYTLLSQLDLSLREKREKIWQ